MNLFPCITPKLIYNEYTKETMQVPCNHCEACKSAKGYNLKTRIMLEASYHRYCTFFTLTYNEDNVPYFVIENDLTNTYLANPFDIHYNGYPVLEYDIQSVSRRFGWSDFDIAYINSIDRLAYCNKKDVQLFIKRLRSKIDYDYNEKLRYYICSEYGPRTYRPHYHGLLFYDSPLVQENILTLLRSSWKLGFVNCSPAGTKSYSYVAKYVSGSSHYPKVYDLKELRPFCLYSKKPSFGTVPIDEKTITGLVRNTDYRLELRENSSVKLIPYPRTLVNRLFPKCREFNQLTTYGRIRAYSFFRECEKSAILIGCQPIDIVKHEHLLQDDPTDTRIFRDYYTSKRVCENVEFLNTTVYDYVKTIENYWSQRDLENLGEFYKFQEKLSTEHPYDMKYIINLYPEFYNNILSNRNVSLDFPHMYESKMKSLGYKDFDYKELGVISLKKLHSLHFRNSVTFKNFINETNHWSYLNSKTKVLNDKFIFKNNIKHLQL